MSEYGPGTGRPGEPAGDATPAAAGAAARPRQRQWSVGPHRWSQPEPHLLPGRRMHPAYRRLLAYSAAMLGVAAGTLLNVFLPGAPESPFLSLFLAAALLGVCFGGLPPGVLAIGLGGVSGVALLAHSGHDLAQMDPELLRVALFAALGIAMCVLVDRLRAGRDTTLASHGQLQLLLRHMPVVAWSTDRDLRVTSVQHDRGELPGLLLPDPSATAPPRSGAALRAHQQALAGEFSHYEVEWKGRRFHAQAEPLRDPDGRIAGTVGAALDMTGIHYGEHVHYLQHEVTRALAVSLTFPDAIPRVLALVGESLGWATAAYWSADREARRMRCLAVWSRNPGAVQAFVFDTEGQYHHMAACLPGKVWQSGQPLWIGDVTRDLSFRRADAAAMAGLRGGLWLPVRSAGAVMGVLELLNADGRPAPPDAQAVLADVCLQLAEFGRRWRAEETTKQLATVLESAPDCVGICDLNGRPLYMNRAGRALLGLTVDGDISRFRIADFFPPWASKLLLEEGIPAALEQGAWHGEAALLNLRTGAETPVSQVIICHKRPDGSPEFFSTIARTLGRPPRD